MGLFDSKPEKKSPKPAAEPAAPVVPAAPEVEPFSAMGEPVDLRARKDELERQHKLVKARLGVADASLLLGEFAWRLQNPALRAGAMDAAACAQMGPEGEELLRLRDLLDGTARPLGLDLNPLR